MSDLKEKLSQLEVAFRELEEQLSQPEVLNNQQEYRKLLKRRAELERLVRKYHELLKAESDHKDLLDMLRDPDEEVSVMAREEVPGAEQRIEELEQELRMLLLPPDPNDEKNIIVEIRAGTGGEEAALFAANLMRMYARYAELQGWKVELLGENKTGLGGFREVSFSVTGQRVYSHLKFEGGAHRVQRIPETEASGRIHTSAVTVAVLPEVAAVDVQVKNEDLRIDVYRSSGPGGQSVNTTDSAVRITHLPTNIVVSIQDEKSQHKNREKAMKVLRARLYEAEQQKQDDKISASKRAMIGSGDRSERIRTYNFPQNRLTDHRIGLSLYKLDRIMEGELDELVSALRLHERTERLKLAETL